MSIDISAPQALSLDRMDDPSLYDLAIAYTIAEKALGTREVVDDVLLPPPMGEEYLWGEYNESAQGASMEVEG